MASVETVVVDELDAVISREEGRGAEVNFAAAQEKVLRPCGGTPQTQ